MCQPFARMTYAQAMERYGCDKPDLRYGLEHADVSSAVRESTFRCAPLCMERRQLRTFIPAA